MNYRLVKKIRNHFAENYLGDLPEAACLHWTKSTVEVLSAELDDRVILQAGTAMFRRIPPHLDDGVVSTHFSYVWSADSLLSKSMIMMNAMPEMHVWAAMPDKEIVIDMTCGLQKEQAALRSMEWLDDTTPDVIWGNPKEVFKDHGIVYEPSLDASVLAQIMLQNSPWGDPSDTSDGNRTYHAWKAILRSIEAGKLETPV